MKKTLMLTALTMALSACDRLITDNDSSAEQDSRLYRAAMNDYRSGRIDAAINGFEKTIAKDPGNASARFQLACLLQDSKRDFVAAYCEYQEYLRQCPDSDKSSIAKDRLKLCEAELAKMLAAKYSLGGSAGTAHELENLQDELKTLKSQLADSRKDLTEVKQQLGAITDERDRLLAMIKSSDDDVEVASSTQSVKTKDLKDLLEEDEDEISPTSSLLPPKTNAAPIVVEEKKPKAKPMEHPATYTVEEGDTLYAIAKRFYGSISAWKAIQSANKALISADGRVRAGDVLTLPDWSK